MGVLNVQACGRKGIPAARLRMLLWALPLVALIIGPAGPSPCWAVQKHTLTPEQSGTGDHAAGAQQPAAGSHAPAAPQQAPSPKDAHSAAPSVQHAVPAHPPAAEHQAEPSGHGAPAGHGEAAGGHGAGEHGGGHGPALPTISPIPGVTFVETMIKLMEHELNGRTLGWRPNDIIVGRFTDNINNYQLGVLEALRFTTLRLKDSLTRLGDADTYDPDLEAALNLLMNKATSFWWPPAESSYGDAVAHLRKFQEKLEKGQRSFYYRRDNLVGLLAVYKDLFGNVDKTLVQNPVSWFQTDDYFYYAKGVTHVVYEILRVVRVGYQNQLATTMYGLDMMDTVLHELYVAEGIDPWLVLDANYGGFFANHRANLNAPLSEAAHLLGVLSQL